MDWRRNIVTCLMLATLLVATSTPVKAARPGFGGLRIGRIGGGQRPRVQNNRPNTGSWTGYRGTGRVNTANTQYTYQNRMRSSLAYEYPDYMSHLINRESNRNLAANPHYWINHIRPYYYPIWQPTTDAPSSRNNYQGSSDASYHYQLDRIREREEQEKRNADELASMVGRRGRDWRRVAYSRPRSEEGASTKVTRNGDIPSWVTVTSGNGTSIRTTNRRVYTLPNPW